MHNSTRMVSRDKIPQYTCLVPWKILNRRAEEREEEPALHFAFCILHVHIQYLCIVPERCFAWYTVLGSKVVVV